MLRLHLSWVLLVLDHLEYILVLCRRILNDRLSLWGNFFCLFWLLKVFHHCTTHLVDHLALLVVVFLQPRYLLSKCSLDFFVIFLVVFAISKLLKLLLSLSKVLLLLLKLPS